MVGDEEKIPRVQILADAADGIGQKQARAAESRGQAHGGRDFEGAVPFVEMMSPLEKEDPPSAETAGDQPPGVTVHRGRRQTGDLGVGESGTAFDLVGEPAEPGAEDDGQVEGLCSAPFADDTGRAVEEVVAHRFSSISFTRCCN